MDKKNPTIEETIVSSKKEYIEIAVKLAGDINFI